MTIEAIKEGIRMWREAAATSPFSLLHLSLCKSPLKHQQHSSDNDDDDWEIKFSEDILMVVHLLLHLAVKHTHVCNRWLLTLILFLEKILGQPRMHCLCMIWLIKADFNLMLKFCASKAMMSSIKSWGSVANEQGGGRRG